MKILFITTMASHPWGGSEELWVQMTKDASVIHIDTAISYYKWDNVPEKIKALEALDVKSFQRRRISYSEMYKKPFGKFNAYAFGLKDLKRPVKAFNPNHMVISMGGYIDLEIPVVQRFLLETNVSFSLIIHANPENRYFSLDTVKKMHQICAKAKTVFFVSKRLLEIAKRQTGFAFNNAKIILNPINMKDSNIQEYIGEKDLFNFACVGRLNASVKGQAILFQVLSQEKWKMRNYRLNIYGNGPDKELFEYLVSKYGLKEKVLFKGHVKDVRNEIWSENHALLMPSYYEGLPLALIEAMLCGRTAMVTDVGGAKEVLDENKGFIAKAATFSCVDVAMDRMWEKREKLLHLGKEVRRDALSYINSFESYQEIIKEMISDNH